jgi:hypothetical protein
MTQTNLGRHPWAAVLTVLSMLLASGAAAQAAEGEDEAAPAAPPEVTPPPKVEPQPAAPAITSEAPATPALEAAPVSAYIEHLGPNTFPGKSRGIYGGSLWLEPTFHGLQWPQNARTGLGVSASFWVDSGYEKVGRDNVKVLDSTMRYQQGRAVLRVTPAYVRDNFFIQGQAELVGNLCQTASFVNTVCNEGTFSTDDLFIRFGQWNVWDLKFGRFQGWEIYHLGMGMDPYTFERTGAGMWGTGSLATPGLEAPAFYGVNYLQDRPTDGLAVGYLAGHAYFTDFLRVELLGKLGTDNYRKDNDNGTGDHPSTSYGGRLAAVFDVGWLKLKAGAEYQDRTSVFSATDATGNKKDPIEETVQKGAGGSVQFVVDPIVEFGVSAAYGKQSYTDTTGNTFGSSDTAAKSFATKSVGGFANLRVLDDLLVGVGAHWTAQQDEWRAENSKANDYTTHLQTFLAVQYLLAKQLYIKAVGAYSRARFQASNPDTPIWENTMFPSVRVRLMYLY